MASSMSGNATLITTGRKCSARTLFRRSIASHGHPGSMDWFWRQVLLKVSWWFSSEVKTINGSNPMISSLTRPESTVLVGVPPPSQRYSLKTPWRLKMVKSSSLLPRDSSLAAMTTKSSFGSYAIKNKIQFRQRSAAMTTGFAMSPGAQISAWWAKWLPAARRMASAKCGPARVIQITKRSHFNGNAKRLTSTQFLFGRSAGAKSATCSQSQEQITKFELWVRAPTVSGSRFKWLTSKPLRIAAEVPDLHPPNNDDSNEQHPIYTKLERT